MCDDPPVVTGRTHGSSAGALGGRPLRAGRAHGAAMSALAADEIVLHGHRVRFHQRRRRAAARAAARHREHRGHVGAGRSPALAARHTVLAPDLLGHGDSAKPRGDYSLGAYASGVRDLLAALGHDRATVVGHSLGGGIAMQFAYQFPERVERLVLVGSGGLGREVHPILRAATLPGSELVLPLLGGAWLRSDGRRGRVAPSAASGCATGEDLAGRRDRDRRRSRDAERARRLRPHRAGGDRRAAASASRRPTASTSPPSSRR